MNSTPHSIVRTKAGRARVQKAIIELAQKIGANTEGREEGREIVMHIKRYPYYAMMIFAGTEPVDVFLAHWNVDHRDREAQYPRDFGVGSLNTCHFRKATSQAATLEGLLKALEMGFAVLPTKEEPK